MQEEEEEEEEAPPQEEPEEEEEEQRYRRFNSFNVWKETVHAKQPRMSEESEDSYFWAPSFAPARPKWKVAESLVEFSSFGIFFWAAWFPSTKMFAGP